MTDDRGSSPGGPALPAFGGTVDGAAEVEELARAAAAGDAAALETLLPGRVGWRAAAGPNIAALTAVPEGTVKSRIHQFEANSIGQGSCG